MAIEMEKGSVSIDAQNIMPVIKRWLYSDKDIFLREVVSNGCDAITKYRMTNPDDESEMSVMVTVDKENKTLTISDTGIGMTEDEVKRYINQVAFSGASEFMKKFEGDEKKGDIIGHFGLGFYSVFMVSENVEIETLSCQEGAEPVHWESKDGMDFAISEGHRTAHGTSIILHISDEEKEFLELYRRFHPLPAKRHPGTSRRDARRLLHLEALQPRREQDRAEGRRGGCGDRHRGRGPEPRGDDLRGFGPRLPPARAARSHRMLDRRPRKRVGAQALLTPPGSVPTPEKAASGERM